jgi:predicted phosphodiesterase
MASKREGGLIRMRYAVLGDIHSNLEALSEAVKQAQRHKVDRFVSVGDIVGYGPDPEACMDTLEKISCEAVAGNHDQGVSGKTDFSHYTEGARAGILWTQEKIGKPYLEKLKALPLARDVEDFSVVHASLDHPAEWDYILDSQHALTSLRLQKKGLCFYGHTHLPVIFRADGTTQMFREGIVSLEKGQQYLINVGSVGQPRDGNPHPCLVIYDSTAHTVQMHRFEYNVVKTQRKILEEGLPASLAMRLSYGR